MIFTVILPHWKVTYRKMLLSLVCRYFPVGILREQQLMSKKSRTKKGRDTIKLKRISLAQGTWQGVWSLSPTRCMSESGPGQQGLQAAGGWPLSPVSFQFLAVTLPHPPKVSSPLPTIMDKMPKHWTDHSSMSSTRSQ